MSLALSFGRDRAQQWPKIGEYRFEIVAGIPRKVIDMARIYIVLRFSYLRHDLSSVEI